MIKLCVILIFIGGIWYIDYNTLQIENSTNNNYEAFDQISQKELSDQKIKFEQKMKEFDNLIFKK